MRVKFCILDVDTVIEDDKPVVRLWGKTDKGKNIVVFDSTFKPYFYVEPKELTKREMEGLKGKIKELKIENRSPELIELVEKKLFGKQKALLKITATNPTDVPKFRDLLKDWVEIKNEYEYGISFYHRYLIDNNLIPMDWVEGIGKKITTDLQVDLALKAAQIKPLQVNEYPEFNTLAFDLELAEEGGEEHIIMISFKDNKGFAKVLTYKKVRAKNTEVVNSEAELLKRFVEIIKERNPEIICGYNSDRFDFVKLDERAKKYKIALTLGRGARPLIFRRRGKISAAQITGRVHVDLFDFIEHILTGELSSEVLTLDRVSKEILGIGKEPLQWKDIAKAWKEEKGLRKVVEYCMHDSELTLSLAEHLLPQIFELSRVTGQTLFDTTRSTYSQLVEWLLIRKAFEINELAPNRPKFDEIQRRREAIPYTGGYVYPPKQGIHDNIALFDFLGLYPSIIVTFNVSPEKLDCDCCNPAKVKNTNKVPDEEHWYCKRAKGFVTKIIEELVKKRAKIKEQMKKFDPESTQYKDLYNRQYALKILANSSYGYYGYPGSRWYSRVCAKSITSWGRAYIKKIIKMAERMGFEVIYGDTDSVFLKLKE